MIIQDKPIKCHGKWESKFVETDWKICFSSQNCDSNLVLYCDSCSIQPAMGQALSPRLREQERLSEAKLSDLWEAQLPYEEGVEALISCHLLDFVKFSLVSGQGVGSKAHMNILKLVVQNELQHGRCGTCAKKPGGELGYQFSCEVAGFNSSLHPIRAFLSGCTVKVHQTREKRLEVSVVGIPSIFSKHSERVCEQAYIRGNQQKDLKQFREKYKKDWQEWRQVEEKNRKLEEKFGNRILLGTKNSERVVSSMSAKKKNQQIEMTTESQKKLRAYKNCQ